MSILKELGEKVLSKTRDDVIDREIDILEGKGNGVINKKLSEQMSLFSDNQKELIKRIIVDAVDATLHELLYNLDESTKFKLVAYDRNGTVNLSEEHEESLVGSFLDSIDDYSKYNSTYDIISKNAKLNKQTRI